MSNIKSKPSHSFRKHYYEIIFYSVLVTLFHFATITIYYLEGVDGESRSFISSAAFIALIFVAILSAEIYSLSYHLALKKVTFRQFLTHLMVFPIAISYQFALIYNTLYVLNPKSFSGLEVKGYFASFFEFIYYSVSILSSSSLSEIKAITFYPKLFSLVESLMFFYLIVIILANYKDFGRAKFGSEIDIIS